MNHSVRTKINWLPPEAGGRQKPPAGPRYSTVAKFTDEEAEQSDQAWSIVIEFSEKPDESGCSEGELRFLVSDAPVHLLYPGNHFSLFEGQRLVATGEVIPEKNS